MRGLSGTETTKCPCCEVQAPLTDWGEVDVGIGTIRFEEVWTCPTHGEFAFNGGGPIFREDDAATEPAPRTEPPASDPAHVAWVVAYAARFPGSEHLLGRCREAVAEMLLAFPTLRIARGHVFDGFWGQRAHWWLVAPNGAIVDPTEGQFPAPFRWEEFVPGTPCRVGKCMSCGVDIYESVASLDCEPPSRTFCGGACERSFL